MKLWSLIARLLAIGRPLLLYAAHFTDSGKLRRRHLAHTEAAEAHQIHILEKLVVLQGRQCHRLLQVFVRPELNGRPVAFLCGSVRELFAQYLGNTNYLLPDVAVVKEREVTFLHRTQIVACGIVAHSGPGSFFVFLQLFPTELEGFGFDQPVVHG